MKNEIGRVRCVCSSSQEPGEGGTKAEFGIDIETVSFGSARVRRVAYCRNQATERGSLVRVRVPNRYFESREERRRARRVARPPASAVHGLATRKHRNRPERSKPYPFLHANAGRVVVRLRTRLYPRGCGEIRTKCSSPFGPAATRHDRPAAAPQDGSWLSHCMTLRQRLYATAAAARRRGMLFDPCVPRLFP
jgi:hypothetical protein